MRYVAIGSLLDSHYDRTKRRFPRASVATSALSTIDFRVATVARPWVADCFLRSPTLWASVATTLIPRRDKALAVVNHFGLSRQTRSAAIGEDRVGRRFQEQAGIGREVDDPVAIEIDGLRRQAEALVDSLRRFGNVAQLVDHRISRAGQPGHDAD